MTVGRARYAVTLDMADRRVKVGERALGRARGAQRRAPPVAAVPGRAARRARSSPSSRCPALGPGAEPRRPVRDPDHPARGDRRRAGALGPRRPVRARAAQRAVDAARSRCSSTRCSCRSRVRARASCATSRARRRATCPTRTCRSTPCATTSRATTGGTSTGGRRRAAAASWSSSSRTPGARTTALALATDPRDYADDDELELAVSVVASVGVQTIREERDLVGARRPGQAPGRDAAAAARRLLRPSRCRAAVRA